ncbi:MAG: NUDIX hydrolase [Acidimicrobiia bacterium]
MGRYQVSGLSRASTVCLVRDRDQLQVLMVQRPHTSRFMPSTWVFPGGAVDDDDANAETVFGTGDDWVVAALRELIEETGLWITTDGVVQRDPVDDAADAVRESPLSLQPDALVYFANWITPRAFPLRFDTRFFLALSDSDAHGWVSGDELVDLEWINPGDALDRARRGSWDVAFPTRKILELLGAAGSADALRAEMLAGPPVQPIEPRLFVTEDEAHILLPHDDLFDAAESAQDDPEIMHRLAAVIAKGGAAPAELN